MAWVVACGVLREFVGANVGEIEGMCGLGVKAR